MALPQALQGSKFELLGVWRPGFDRESDKEMSLICLKKTRLATFCDMQEHDSGTCISLLSHDQHSRGSDKLLAFLCPGECFGKACTGQATAAHVQHTWKETKRAEESWTWPFVNTFRDTYSRLHLHLL